MNKTNLLLLNPSDKTQMYGTLATSLSAIEPPLWAGLIAGFIRQMGFSVKIIDADAENWDAEEAVEKTIESEPLLVGIGALGANPSASSTPKMDVASKILKILKNENPHIKTFLYGIHPSALPEKTLKEEPADFVCRGECFYTVLQLLEILQSGKDPREHRIDGLCFRINDKIILSGWGRLIQDIDSLPFVAWDLLPMDKYRAHNWHCFSHLNERQAYASIYTSLGCPFDCTYCNIRALYNGKPGIRFRSPKRVVEEIDYLVKNYKVKNIKILDELFALKESHVIEFCELIIQHGYDLNMWAYARIDTVNEKLLKKMKEAGINWLSFGIESGSRKIREGIAKGSFGQDAIKKAIEMTHKAGIYVIGNFMFGLPEDDLETMQETLNMAKGLSCEYVNFYTTIAYPGSKLYEEVDSRDLPHSWLGFSQFAYETQPLPTKYLTAAEILRFRDNAFNDYYGDGRYQKMILEKFGEETLQHVKDMLRYNFKRGLLGDENTYNKNRGNG